MNPGNIVCSLDDVCTSGFGFDDCFYMDVSVFQIQAIKNRVDRN